MFFKGFNYINGKFESVSDAYFEAINPATETVYARFPKTDRLNVEMAVTLARRAFEFSWRLVSRVKRAEYFDTLAQIIKVKQALLRDAISLETGKNLNESHAEVIEALHMCQYVASCGRMPFGEVVASELETKYSYVIRKPRGVVAVISPWNFPLAIGSFWCAAPAILEGNTVVHKPSELTPKINALVAECYHEAGFPAGVFNVINGDGETGEALVESKVDVVLFTGSAEVGASIKLHCAQNPLKTCSIECGSKSAMMIFDDGDVNLGIKLAIASAFKLSGQRCVSSGRILIQSSVYDEFCSKFTEEASSLIVTDPFAKGLDDRFSFGPLISMEHYNRVAGFNNLVREDREAEVLWDPDGKDGTLRNQFGWKGYFLRPFVYQTAWRKDTPYLKNEVFGPHVALIPFDTIDDAIHIFNDTDYGLSLGAVTNDYRKHRRLAQDCDVGMLYINGSSIGAESHLPFSSWKKSGWGASAASTYKAVTHTMAVTVNYEEGGFSFAQGMK